MRPATQSDRPGAVRAQIHTERRRRRWPSARTWKALAFTAAFASGVLTNEANGGAPGPDTDESIVPTRVESLRQNPGTPLLPIPLDPAARLLTGDDASESWALYIELESGHRITQRFLLSNAGPGNHNAVAIGHLVEPGREPYRYENGRRRARWTLSEDRLFFDIAASHLDLHRPTGELRITKDDIEIRLFFEFPERGLSGRVPRDQLPGNYHVEVLAVAARTHGTIHAPWMSGAREMRGRTWLVHTWTQREAAELLDRRVEIYGHDEGTSFYGIDLRRDSGFTGAWILAGTRGPDMVESLINIPASWTEARQVSQHSRTGSYPVPSRFDFSRGPHAGQITLGPEWLRFDPLAVIPQPFRWFVRRKSKPREVWAEARIGVTLSTSLERPSLPDASEIESASNSNRETEEETAERSVTGVASITFLNPSERR